MGGLGRLRPARLSLAARVAVARVDGEPLRLHGDGSGRRSLGRASGGEGAGRDGGAFPASGVRTVEGGSCRNGGSMVVRRLAARLRICFLAGLGLLLISGPVAFSSTWHDIWQTVHRVHFRTHAGRR
jgi:hypothetical protein